MNKETSQIVRSNRIRIALPIDDSNVDAIKHTHKFMLHYDNEF